MIARRWSALLATALATIAASAAQAQDRYDLRIGQTTILTAHPSNATSNFGSRVLYAIYEPVLPRDFQGGPQNAGAKPKAGIAESWNQVSPTVFEMKIRKGVLLHNGREVTPQDVAHTFSRQFGEKPAQPYALARGFAAVEVDGDIVRIVSKQPDVLMQMRISTDMGFLVPEKELADMGTDAFNRAPISAGPYKFQEQVQGQFLRLVSHDQYFRGMPPLKSITYKEVPEQSGRLSALVAGDLDIITSVPPDQIRIIERYADLKTASVPVENFHMWLFRGPKTKDAPASHPVFDKRVRQAMAHAVNREQLAERLWAGLTKVPTAVNFPMFGDYYDASKKPLGYDPAKAKMLLQEAGYKGEEIELRWPAGYYVNMDRAIEVAHEQWKQVGLNVKLSPIESISQISQPKGNMWAISGNVILPDPLGGAYLNYAPGLGFSGGFNSWDTPKEFVELGEKMSMTTDVADRKKMFARQMEIFDDEVPAIPLYQIVETYGLRKKIDWKPISLYLMDFRPGTIAVAK